MPFLAGHGFRGGIESLRIVRNAVAPPTLADGTVLSQRYEILRLVGSGGMGEVYEGLDRVLDKRVAVKVLHADAAIDERVAARFVEEAKIASAFRHQHVAESFDFGTHEGRPFLVLEFLEGESLAEVLGSVRTVEPRAAVALVEPIARALSRAHRAGIIHRDVKPENIFLARSDAGECVPKLVDFGVAKRQRPEALKLTNTAVIIGTPSYMAPEQARGTPPLSPAADQYALAVVLFELVSGALPHEAPSHNALLIRKLFDPPRLLRTVAPWASEALESSLHRALATEPDQRFADMESFRLAIVAAVGGVDEPRVPTVVRATRTPSDSGPRQTAPTQDSHETAGLRVAATELAHSPTLEQTPAAQSDTPPAVAAQPGPARDRALRPRLTVFAGGAAIALAALALGVRRAPVATSVETPPSAPPTTIVRLAQAASTSHMVSLRAIPSHTRVLLDGREVGRGPTDVRVEHGRSHTLALEAEGFLPRTERRAFEHDERIEFALEPTHHDETPAPAATTDGGVAIVRAGPAASRPRPRGAYHLGRTGITLDTDFPTR